MALFITVEKSIPNFAGTVSIENAYVKAASVTANKNLAVVNVEYFTTVDGEMFEQTAFEFEPSVTDGSANFIKQAYVHLKSLPEFAGATDV